MADLERIRLVLLGGAGVGKSSIAKRFLFKTYTDKYRATVEDLYNREYDLGGVTLKVDILDTSGDMQFPAMRRLSIATAHAFMLVYAATSAPSFQCVKQCFEEIREQRGDFQDIPIVIAGNKADLATTHREVKLEEVTDWVFCELPRLRTPIGDQTNCRMSDALDSPGECSLNTKQSAHPVCTYA
ncbi:GTP-binding protein Di-Ras2 isoform X2 [Drosophila ficusphila]|uniref:GTP-binding protein Di-Ras2 isoform X2 n=1 Tax=Drosophila ficusphila TaxID=30025 RepID=UPI0007E8790E|nr:GTP-binding protein Di-Ras2 isoform X2 [Drosophila ficusphila]